VPDSCRRAGSGLLGAAGQRPAPRRIEFEEDLDVPDFLKND